MESPLRPDLSADPDFRLIETFGFYPGQGLPRLDLHLRRMDRSARALGVPFDRHGAKAMLQEIDGPTAMRCRFTVDALGQTELTTAPLPPAKPWRVAIADQRLNSADPWLAHKTTRREIYDTARANLPDGVDELIFLNERDEVCEGTITNIFVWTFAGPRVTPPLSCGLLPGVLRESLLNKGQYREATLTLKDLRRARSICMGNSLRGLMSCEYVGPTGPLA
ncbi:MAG: aminotransferase class IV family protein [Pelagimonas sp.]|jgi:4-amino-4-deoxychorismate lyase|nr:aminotransferase class IV family protein [Pelagimonas sp.]